MTQDVLLIRKLMSRQSLSRAESAELVETLLRQDTQGWKILAFSVASQIKGETVDELLGMCDAMRALTGDYRLDLAGRRPFEVSSAGGSGVPKINVSTLAALVAGAPEAPVIQHSFWKVSGMAGSTDALAAVGISVPSVTLEQVQKAVDAVGVAFYSPFFVSAGLGNLIRFGESLAAHQVGVSTPFHLLGPLFSPVPLQYRMFGLSNPLQFEMVTELLRGLGYRNGLIVRGFEGLDEASITSPSRVLGFRNGEDLDFVLLPEDVGLKRALPEEVLPVDAESSCRDFVRIVHGAETGPKRDLVALNAGLALWLSEQAASIEEGIRVALERLASGEVAEKLAKVVELTGAPEVLRQAREKLM